MRLCGSVMRWATHTERDCIILNVDAGMDANGLNA